MGRRDAHGGHRRGGHRAGTDSGRRWRRGAHRPGPADRRGAHRDEPGDGSTLANVGHVLESTVPKRVQPPRLLTVLLLSGVTLALTLFAYSTTQIYLKFSEPPMEQGAAPSPSTTPDSGSKGGPAKVSYGRVEPSGDRFSATVRVTNTGRSELERWELTLDFADARVVSASGAQWKASGSEVTLTGSGDDRVIAPGESANVRLNLQGSEQRPSSCSLNEHPCGLDKGH